MWLKEKDKLRRNFIFKDFKEAFAFMTEVAAVAEQLNHPEWTNTYHKVSITLCTHKVGPIITERDDKLAAANDAITTAKRSLNLVAAYTKNTGTGSLSLNL